MNERIAQVVANRMNYLRILAATNVLFNERSRRQAASPHWIAPRERDEHPLVTSDGLGSNRDFSLFLGEFLLRNVKFAQSFNSIRSINPDKTIQRYSTLQPMQVCYQLLSSLQTAEKSSPTRHKRNVKCTVWSIFVLPPYGSDIHLLTSRMETIHHCHD